jgi:G2/mitotic-specific cyclin 3/4
MLVTEIQKNLQEKDEPQPSPFARHDITWDYRTKMVDWMVEVCTSFKTSERAYFLSVSLFDNYLRRISQKVENKDIHLIGLGCMYLGSKYEDVNPLLSKTVADKIAHKAFTQV